MTWKRMLTKAAFAIAKRVWPGVAMAEQLITTPKSGERKQAVVLDYVRDLLADGEEIPPAAWLDPEFVAGVKMTIDGQVRIANALARLDA